MSRLLLQVESEAAALRKDIRSLRSSKLQEDPEVGAMLHAAAEHHRHLTLSRLAGKTEDTIRKLVTDTYMFGVLIKMLREVDAKEKGRSEALTRVKLWYGANKDKLASLPKFSAPEGQPQPRLVSLTLPRRAPPPPTHRRVRFPSQRRGGGGRRSAPGPREAGEEEERTAPPPLEQPEERAESLDGCGDAEEQQVEEEEDKEEQEFEDEEDDVEEEDEDYESDELSEDEAEEEEEEEQEALEEAKEEEHLEEELEEEQEPEPQQSLEEEEHAREPPAPSPAPRPVHPISSYVTLFAPGTGPGEAEAAAATRQPKPSPEPPPMRTVHRVLRDHARADRQLWREEDEAVLRERRLQAEIARPRSRADLLAQSRALSADAVAARPRPGLAPSASSSIAACDVAAFLRLTAGYYPLRTRLPPPQPRSAPPPRNPNHSVDVGRALDALGDVAADLDAIQRQEMAVVRWEDRVEPIRLISHLACPPSRESAFPGPEPSSLLLLESDERCEPGRTLLLDSAADWRGKVSPSPAPEEARSPSRAVSRHSFVQRLLQQRRRQSSQRFRPLSAPAPPPDRTCSPCAPSVPGPGRATPPELDAAGLGAALAVRYLGGAAEEPWEEFLRRLRLSRRAPLRKGPLRADDPGPAEFLSLVTPATALGVFGVVDALPDALASDGSCDLSRASQASLAGSTLLAPGPTPATGSFADMERARSAARPGRWSTGVQRSAPSIPSARDAPPPRPPPEPESSRHRLGRLAPPPTARASRPATARPDPPASREALAVVGLTLNRKSASADLGLPPAALLNRKPPESPARSDSRCSDADPGAASRPSSAARARTQSARKPGGRPIPHLLEVEAPEERARRADMLKDAATGVDIHKIFHAHVPQNFLLRLTKEQRERLEDERRAAVVIQRVYRSHLSRCRSISAKARNGEMKRWTRAYHHALDHDEKARQRRLEDQRRQVSAVGRLDAQKIAMVGPHVDIYENFHPVAQGPTRRERHVAAVVIQRWVRGWLTRLFMARLRRKALYHAGSLGAFVKDYFALMRRIQRRNGVRQPVSRFDLREMEQFMDTKRKYELAFDGRAFRGRLRERDIMAFFDACDLSPAAAEVREALELLHRDSPQHVLAGLDKADALEMAFQVYKPRGTDLHDSRRSTWMHPLVRGVDAVRLVDESQLEPTPLSACLRLVLDSRRDSLSWEQLQRVKAEIRGLEEAEASSAGDRSARERARQEAARRPQFRPGVPWVRD